MEKTIFEITKMDCPSEENLIRMKLDGISSIANLDFDIPNRKLTIFHNGRIDQIEKSVIELNLGGKKISTEQTDQTEFKENENQKKLLWSVLVINFAFFIFSYCQAQYFLPLFHQKTLDPLYPLDVSLYLLLALILTFLTQISTL